MDNRKTIIANNIRELLRLADESISAFARRAEMAPSTLTTFLKYPEERNITLDHLFAIADISSVELWNMMIGNFPFEALRPYSKTKNRLTGISAEGYALLHAFENAPSDMVRYAMLDSIAMSLSRVDEKSSQKIKDIQSKYLAEKRINPT